VTVSESRGAVLGSNGHLAARDAYFATCYPVLLERYLCDLCVTPQASAPRGEMEAEERMLIVERAALANLDAAIGLFEGAGDPSLIRAIRPVHHGNWFRHSKQMRLCMAAFREAKVPLSAGR
jgi:hypothetical protein